MRTNRDTNTSTTSISSRKPSTIKKNPSSSVLSASTPKGLSSKGHSFDSDDFYENQLDSHRSNKKLNSSSIKIDLDSIKKDAMSKEKSGMKPKLSSSNRKSVVQMQTGPGSIVMNDYSNFNFDTVNK